MYDCSPISDGAVGLMLSCEKTDIRVSGLGHATDTVSLKNRVSLSHFAATKLAAKKAYKSSSLSPKDIDFAEADEFIVTEDLRERKTIMEQKSDAFIALPGGIGTLDEIAETLTLIQLKQISKPLVLINYQNFYSPLIKLFDSAVEQKLAKENFLDSYYLAENNFDAMNFLTNLH